MNCTASGNINLVEYILNKNNKILLMTSLLYGTNMIVNILDTGFITALTNGHIDLCEWLLFKRPLIDVTLNTFQGFTTCCSQGHINAAKWFIKRYPRVSQTIAVEISFSYACMNSRSDIANWLYTLKKLDVGFNNEQAFRLVCSKNNINVAKALFTIRPQIDITVNDYEPIRTAVKNNAIDVINWLKEFKPEVFLTLKDAPWIQNFI
jgi:hypothetical protein